MKHSATWPPGDVTSIDGSQNSWIFLIFQYLWILDHHHPSELQAAVARAEAYCQRECGLGKGGWHQHQPWQHWGEHCHNFTKSMFVFLVSAHLDPRRNNPRPGQLQQTGNTQSSWSPGNIQKQESVLQSQVKTIFFSDFLEIKISPSVSSKFFLCATFRGII